MSLWKSPGWIPDSTHDLSLPATVGEPSYVHTACTAAALSSCLISCFVQQHVCSLTAAAEICAGFTHLPVVQLAVDRAVSLPHTPIPRLVTECGQSCPVYSSHPESRLLQCCLKRGAGGGPRWRQNLHSSPWNWEGGCCSCGQRVVNEGVRFAQKGGDGRWEAGPWHSRARRGHAAREAGGADPGRGSPSPAPGSAGKSRGFLAPRWHGPFLLLAARRSRGCGTGAGSRGGCRGNRRHVLGGRCR